MSELNDRGFNDNSKNEDEDISESIEAWIQAEEVESNKTKRTSPSASFLPIKKRQQTRVELLQQSLYGKHKNLKKKELNENELEIGDDNNIDRKFVRQTDETLLAQAETLLKAKQIQDLGKSDFEKQREEDEKILEAVSRKDKELAGAHELAKGIKYTEPMKTNWRPIAKYRNMSVEQCELNRKDWHIIVEGDGVPPPINSFKEMRIPKPLVKFMAKKGIRKPTPIQKQGLPVALMGRDMIGIAFTGSGKTLAFSLPLIALGLEAELKLPFVGGEGPVGLILCPSRELARQTYEGIEEMSEALHRGGYPRLKTLLCIGGINMSQQSHLFQSGFHAIVATPGRLQDLLNRKQFNLNLCKYLCLDEADRMVDMGFDEDIRNILTHFPFQRQTLLFSATMPRKVLEFAQSSLVQPILVNVGRAGAANLDVVQEVEYVKQDAKMVYLLDALQKTSPPVLIFAENKNDVDDITEYLLIKEVQVVAIHGSKTQDEREYAISSFKAAKKDVLVATDVASKGLDFANIQHVINYDMPKEIEDYVHRIGRTGRSGKTGIATTFINPQSSSEQILLDLKYLLIEAKQRVPQILLEMDDPNQHSTGNGCSFCGGLGHRISDCPKLENQNRATQQTQSNNINTMRGDY